MSNVKNKRKYLYKVMDKKPNWSSQLIRQKLFYIINLFAVLR